MSVSLAADPYLTLFTLLILFNPIFNPYLEKPYPIPK